MKKQADMMLVSLVDSWADGKQEFKQLISDYKNQDVGALLADMSKSKSMDSDFENDLLVTRNQNWIPKMQQITKEKPTFFAVGTGHLGGKKGVIALLKNAGFTVKAVQN